MHENGVTDRGEEVIRTRSCFKMMHKMSLSSILSPTSDCPTTPHFIQRDFKSGISAALFAPSLSNPPFFGLPMYGFGLSMKRRSFWQTTAFVRCECFVGTMVFVRRRPWTH